MAFTVTESHAVNTLLVWLLGDPGRPAWRPPVPPGEAMEAAELLAGRAYKTLSAGIDPARVRKLWFGRAGSAKVMNTIKQEMTPERQQMVDERVCRVLLSLPERPAESAGEEALIDAYMADEWACLEVAAMIVAPAYGLDGADPDVIEPLKRAAHQAMKVTCERLIRFGLRGPRTTDH